MEAFYSILGLFIMYSWIHAIVILASKKPEETKYEKFIKITGLVLFALYILGTLSK